MWVPGPPVLFLWPEQMPPAGFGASPNLPLPEKLRSPDWGLLALSRQAAYWQLKLSLPFCPEQSRRVRPRRVAEKKGLGSAPERQSRCQAGCCADCRRKAFSLPLCGWRPPSAQWCGQRGSPSWWEGP